MKTEDTEVLGRQRAKLSKIKARYSQPITPVFTVSRVTAVMSRWVTKMTWIHSKLARL